MAFNLYKSLVRNAVSVIHGNPLTDAEKEQRVKPICQQCPWYRKLDERCAHKDCGCFTRMKTWLTAEVCPAGKW
jgi:hypothetical protein